MGRLRFVRNHFPYPAPDVYDLQLAVTGVGTVGGARNVDITACGLSFTRTTAAWDDALTSYAAGVPVITAARGLYLEQPATNFFLHSTAPVTQTVSLVAGDYAVSLAGSGSVAVSGGASGTATAAAPFVFNLGAAATVTLTKSGTVTFCQVEDNPHSTSPIVTAGAAVQRTGAFVVGTRPPLTQGTLAFKARSATAPAAGTAANALWQVDDGSNTNRMKLDRSDSRVFRLVTTSAGSTVATTIGTLGDDADIVVVVAFGAGSVLVKSNLGADVGPRALTLPAANLTNERLGNVQGHLSAWDRSIARAARWSTPLAAADCAAVVANF